MIKKHFLTNNIVVIGMMVLLAHPVSAVDVNKDIRNIGTAKAYDVAVELSGNTGVTDHYDGYANGHFGSFSSGPIGPNTLLHWQNFDDADNDAIDPGQTIHIGWSTPYVDELGHIKDMYWTGIDGQKLPGSKLCNTRNGWTYEQASRRVIVRWQNNFQKGCKIIHISHVGVAILAERIPLAELNYENLALNERFSPLFPTSPDTNDRSLPFAVLPDHDVMAYVNLPEGVSSNSRLVLRYNVIAEGSEAEATDFVQSDPIATFPLESAIVSGQFVNKDIKNIGNTQAYDVAVELAGNQVVGPHFDGYPIGSPKGGHFSSFSWGPIGPNTKLHWQNFYDGVNHVIDPGQTIHIGWGIQGNQGHIKDMYWTDATGQKIPGSKLCNLTTGWKYEQDSKKIRILWRNLFLNGCHIIHVSDVMFAISPDLIPLAELNFENARLNQRLSPLPTSTGEPLAFEISSNQEFVTSIDAPEMSPSSRLILRYAVAGEGSEVEATDFVESDPAKELSVGLTKMMAQVGEEGIHLNWTTGSETDNAGFRLWRATAGGYGIYTHVVTLKQMVDGQRLTALPVANGLSDLIPALGRKDQGRSYAYVDTDPAQDVTYYYLLEDVDMNGIRTFHCDNLMAVTVGQGPVAHLEDAKEYCRMATSH